MRIKLYFSAKEKMFLAIPTIVLCLKRGERSMNFAWLFWNLSISGKKKRGAL